MDVKMQQKKKKLLVISFLPCYMWPVLGKMSRNGKGFILSYRQKSEKYIFTKISFIKALV